MRQRSRTTATTTTALFLLVASRSITTTTAAFGPLHPQHGTTINDAWHVLQQTVAVQQNHHAAVRIIEPQSFAHWYELALQTHPLATKAATGGILSVAGDAIAQKLEHTERLDARRNLSFAIFTMLYRALQHVVYPIVIAACTGQWLGPWLPSFVAAAAVEQTVVAQLVIVPLLYYPTFFVVTGFVQGLTAHATLERARDKFGPVMRRNWYFWLPVQYIQFGYVPDDYQIPFLSVASFIWSFVLSIMAGNAGTKTKDATVLDEVSANLVSQVWAFPQEAAITPAQDNENVATKRSLSCESNKRATRESDQSFVRPDL